MVDRLEIDLASETQPEGINDEGSNTAKDRPDWLPDKFDSPEDMANAYSELEHKLGSDDSKESDSGDSEVSETLTPEFLSKYSEKYFQEGLSPDDYKAMEAKGLPRHLVDQFAAGMEALQGQQAGQIYEEVGGEKSYLSMIDWASNNLPEAEVNQFNDIIGKGVMDEMMMAVKGLHSRWQQGGGKEASLVEGSTKGSGESNFQSTQQVIQAMNDPRYAKDPAFREEVQRKLANSQRL